MKKAALLSVIVFGTTAILVSCERDKDLQTQTVELVLPESNSQTDNQFSLGRTLFYDNHLSLSNSVSCGSCHKQSEAFADDVRFSKGFNGELGTRNTPAIQNLGNSSTFFWDGREHALSNMVTKPVMNHAEMGLVSPDQILARVKAQSYYKELFTKAFGDEEITINRISSSLSFFVGSISSRMGSKFENRNSAILTAEELKGLDLFDGKYNCTSCHVPSDPKGYNDGGNPTDPSEPFTGFQPIMVNIGLDAEYADNGLGALTKNPEQNGMFKIPNLKNVAITAPYMHDGRFNTLEEVMDHYSDGIKDHPNLDGRLKDEQTGHAVVMNIPAADKKALIAFLHTLTDNSIRTNPQFSNPFKSK